MWKAPVLSESYDVHQRVRAVRLLTTIGEVQFVNAIRVEEAAYKACTLQNTDYNAKMLQLAWSLKSNAGLIAQFTPDVLVLLDDQSLAPTEVNEWWKQHNDQLQRQRQLLSEEAKFEETEQQQSTSANGVLTCNRCHSRSIAVQQQQIRSADEGMTVFCTCNKCGMRWKM
jgi:DNA-directed RNA polymerase subunit M/transcription elongation factor TFIIS